MECDNCDETFTTKYNLKKHFIKGCVSVPHKRKKSISKKKKSSGEVIPTLEQFKNEMIKEGIAPNKRRNVKGNGLNGKPNQTKSNQPKRESEIGYLKLNIKPNHEGKTKREVDYLNFLEFKSMQKRYESEHKLRFNEF